MQAKKVQAVYFTGMFTADQGDLGIQWLWSWVRQNTQILSWLLCQNVRRHISAHWSQKRPYDWWYCYKSKERRCWRNGNLWCYLSAFKFCFVSVICIPCNTDHSHTIYIGKCTAEVFWVLQNFLFCSNALFRCNNSTLFATDLLAVSPCGFDTFFCTLM